MTNNEKTSFNYGLFGKRMKKIRGNSTQGSAAYKAGVSKKQWLRWENGSVPRLDTAYDICSCFDVTADYLIGLDVEPHHVESDIHKHTGLCSDAIEILKIWNNNEMYKQNIEALNEMLVYENKRYKNKKILYQSIFHYIWNVIHSDKIKGLPYNLVRYRHYIGKSKYANPFTGEHEDRYGYKVLEVGDTVVNSKGERRKIKEIEIVNRVAKDADEVDNIYYEDTMTGQPYFMPYSAIVEKISKDRILEILGDMRWANIKPFR